MRSLLVASVFALSALSVPSAHAMGPKSGHPKAGHPKAKKGGKHDHDHDGDGKGKGKGKGKKQVYTITGAGQRLHFSFGGQLKYNATDNVLKGKFSIIVHPLAPPGDIVNTVCRYGEMTNPQLDGNDFQFDASGKCRSLHLDGSITVQEVTSHVMIQDNKTGTDGIDVDLVGSTGVAVPGGALSHGDFAIAPK